MKMKKVISERWSMPVSKKRVVKELSKFINSLEYKIGVTVVVTELKNDYSFQITSITDLEKYVDGDIPYSNKYIMKKWEIFEILQELLETTNVFFDNWSYADTNTRCCSFQPHSEFIVYHEKENEEERWTDDLIQNNSAFITWAKRYGFESNEGNKSENKDKLTSELINKYGIIKLGEDSFAIEFMDINAKEHDYDSDIVYIDSKVGELKVQDGGALIVAPISENTVQIWNVDDSKDEVIINGYMGSDDSTFYFLNSLGRWFLENKNININVVTHLYYNEKDMLDYVNRLENCD